jgi:multimeric flavodoxin WrbA
MKVIAILSSPSRNGNTAVLARKALDGARSAGADTEEIFLADYGIEFCKGCFGCMKKGKCPIGDDFEPLRDKVYASDCIILASPSYGLQPNARMKNFWMDRMGMYTVYTASLAGKYYLGLSTAGGIGANKTAKSMALGMTFGIFGKGYASGYLGVLMGDKRFGMTTIDDHPDALARAYELGKKLVSDARSERKFVLQHFAHNLFMRVFLKPLMIKNVLANKDGFLKAVYENLSAKGLISA